MQYLAFYANGDDPGDPEGEIILVRRFEDSEGSTEFAAGAPDDCDWIIDPTETATPQTHYVDVTGAPTLALRPVLSQRTDFLIEADGLDAVVFEVPAGTKIVDIEAGSEVTVGSTEDFEFTATKLGNWSMSFSPPFPYVPVVIRISTNADL